MSDFQFIFLTKGPRDIKDMTFIKIINVEKNNIYSISKYFLSGTSESQKLREKDKTFWSWVMLYEVENNKMFSSSAFCFITPCPVLLAILTSIRHLLANVQFLLRKILRNFYGWIFCKWFIGSTYTFNHYYFVKEIKIFWARV